jgi:hypothetical protein
MQIARHPSKDASRFGKAKFVDLSNGFGRTLAISSATVSSGYREASDFLEVFRPFSIEQEFPFLRSSTQPN